MSIIKHILVCLPMAGTGTHTHTNNAPTVHSACLISVWLHLVWNSEFEFDAYRNEQSSQWATMSHCNNKRQQRYAHAVCNVLLLLALLIISIREQNDSPFDFIVSLFSKQKIVGSWRFRQHQGYSAHIRFNSTHMSHE